MRPLQLVTWPWAAPSTGESEGRAEGPALTLGPREWAPEAGWFYSPRLQCMTRRYGEVHRLRLLPVLSRCPVEVQKRRGARYLSAFTCSRLPQGLPLEFRRWSMAVVEGRETIC